MLTQAELKSRLHYDVETGIFTWIKSYHTAKIGKIAGSIDCNGYIRIKINNKKHLNHRLAWIYVYGKLPIEQIDHINGIRSDNRISNLRLATSSQNMMNIGSYLTNKSGYKGVSFNKKLNKYIAQIQINGNKKYLGCFVDPEIASMAYQNIAKELHGEFYNGIK